MGTTDRPERSAAIDFVRGLVMVLMVLDHARDFFFGVKIRPTDLAVTTVGLFATRFVTHFCAPVFVFLAGTAAYLYGVKYGPQRLSRFLVRRGAFLVLLELTVVRLCWIPDPGYHFTLLQVIWVLGWSMIILAGLCRLPVAAPIAVGAVLVAGHNLLDGVRAQSLGSGIGTLWKFVHQGGWVQPLPGHGFHVAYPLIPWVGVMALGFGFGQLFTLSPERRRPLMLKLGLAAVILFVLLRAVNGYGNPSPWQPQPRGALFTVLSFLNCEKYPPSLLYLLMTLGPALCLLGAVDGRTLPGFLQPLVTFGRVPLLFYVAHLALLRYASIPLALHRWGGAASALLPPPGHAGSPEYPLWSAYLAWIAALLLLYPLCRWFAALKARRASPWLSYL